MTTPPAISPAPVASAAPGSSPAAAGWRRLAAAALRQLVFAEQVVSILLLTTVILTMAAQVIWRYVLQSPLSWSEEVARFAMIWLTFIAASFVLATRQHIVVDVIGDHWQHGQWLLRILRLHWLVPSILLGGALVLLIGGLPFVLRVYPVGSPSVGVSMTYWYAAPLVGLTLMVVHLVAQLLGIDKQ